MKNILLFATITFIVVACSQPKEDGLEGKKTALADLKKQQSEIAAQIKTLEAEITKLDPKKAEDTRSKAVVVTLITPSTFEHFIDVSGTVDTKNNVMVSPQMAGAIKNLYVKEGDVVGNGTLLARLDDQVLRESIEEVKNQLGLATTFFEKQSRLWEQQIGTELQFLQAKNNKESLEKRIQTLETQLAMAKVTSPLSGVVDKVLTKQGQMGMPGVPMLQIVNLSSLKAVARVADTYAASVKKGDMVKVSFPDIQKDFTAKVSFVSTTVDPMTRTFTIEAVLPSVRELKPNMLAQVQIKDVAKPASIVIDESIIQNTELGKIVYVAENENGKQVAKARVVKTGQSYAGKIEILDGLRSGDALVTTGYQDLAPGQVLTF